MPVLALFMGLLASVGRAAIGMSAATGRLALFAARASSHIFRPPWYPVEFLRQLLRIGYFSLPVVGMTALFTGGALALQIYAGGSRFNAESVVPSIVAIGMTRELGPVLGGLMVAGRVSASVAAEIATMRVTEQIDALATLSTNPFKYLVAPRLLAATLAMPVLAFIGDIIGVMGGFLVGVGRVERQRIAGRNVEAERAETILEMLGQRRADVNSHSIGRLDQQPPRMEVHLAADPAASRRVWHQNAIAACEREICRKRSALVATLFLDDLHQKDLAYLDHFLNLIFPAQIGTKNVLALIFIFPSDLNPTRRCRPGISTATTTTAATTTSSAPTTTTAATGTPPIRVFRILRDYISINLILFPAFQIANIITVFLKGVFLLCDFLHRDSVFDKQFCFGSTFRLLRIINGNIINPANLNGF